MNTPDKCPHCGAVKVEIDGDWVVYSCESAGLADEFCQTSFCRERAAHAETRKREDALKLQFDQAVAQRDFWEKRCDEKDAEIKREREKWEKLRRWLRESYGATWVSMTLDKMNHLDAEAKGGR